MVLMAVWDLNPSLLRISQNPKCYNIVNECSMSVFRMAASNLGSDLKLNLAPTGIYMSSTHTTPCRGTDDRTIPSVLPFC